MTRRRTTLSAAALSMLVAGGVAAWAFIPARVHAGPAAQPQALTQTAPIDPWTKGPVDRDNMVQGILDYRSERARR